MDSARETALFARLLRWVRLALGKLGGLSEEQQSPCLANPEASQRQGEERADE